jgi:hypothetical protein
MAGSSRVIGIVAVCGRARAGAEVCHRARVGVVYCSARVGG